MGRAEYEFISQIKGYAPYCFNYDNDNTFKRCCKFFFLRKRWKKMGFQGEGNGDTNLLYNLKHKQTHAFTYTNVYAKNKTKQTIIIN
jgi:hypothetical protein